VLKSTNEKHGKLVQILLKDAENAKAASTDMEHQINARNENKLLDDCVLTN
jgi:hypothetical protein